MSNQLPLYFKSELVIDNFAGGGGASTGIEAAIGRPVDIAINHDPEALAMHAANHPHTAHYCESVWDIDPIAVTRNQPVGLVWLSPDCKHFSKAKGGKPVEKKIRGLAWVALRWAAKTRPRVIMLENVEEFVTWGPIGDDGRPCPKQKGRTFNTFVSALNRQGYKVEWRELRACDYGAPTIRKRLFLIARRDGLPIRWPEPTHGDPASDAVKRGRLQPWRTAAECIDWSIPCPSIFDRARPLADATCRRIAKGIMRYVINAAQPYIVEQSAPFISTYYGDKRPEDVRGISLDKPLPTQTTENRHALVAPFLTEHANGSTQRNFDINSPLRTQCAQVKGGHFALVSPTLIQTGYGERKGQSPRVPGLDKPLGTIVAGGQKHALVSAFLAKHYTGVVGSELAQPLGTVTSVDHHSLVSAYIRRDYGQSVGHSADTPLGTITAGGGGKSALVSAFLTKFYGNEKDGVSLHEPMHTVTSKDRFALVTVNGQEYRIADIGMRMLQPRELFRAQGFPDNYIIGDDPEQGLSLTKTAQVRMVGNSVCPPLAQALVEANFKHESLWRAA